MMGIFLSAFLAAFFPRTVLAAEAPTAPPILVDGEIDDWAGLEPVASDPRGDGAADGLDFGRLWMTHDAESYHLLVELGRELNLQDSNTVRLLLDIDADASTGRPQGGLGVEIEWDFGLRRGRRFFDSGPRAGGWRPIEYQDLALVTAPTVTSDTFEIVLSRQISPGAALRLAFIDRADGAAPVDRLPDVGGVRYAPTTAPPPPVEPIPLAKRDPAHVRVLSYNTNNHLLEPARRAAYGRLLAALEPDLLLLQEVRDDTSAEVLEDLSPFLKPGVETWHHARLGGEKTVLLSPYPILAERALGESGAFLLGLGPGRDLLLVGLSMPCCRLNRERREEVDRILAFVRDARDGTGPIRLRRATPIVLIGDANLVGDASQRAALIGGTIVDTKVHGPTFAPDWDETSFVDLKPRHTDARRTFTWVGESFSPGRLDYVIYSDSVLEIGNRFVLHTPGMPAAALDAAGLEHDDTATASDHLPLVVDLVVGPAFDPDLPPGVGSDTLAPEGHRTQ